MKKKSLANLRVEFLGACYAMGNAAYKGDHDLAKKFFLQRNALVGEIADFYPWEIMGRNRKMYKATLNPRQRVIAKWGCVLGPWLGRRVGRGAASAIGYTLIGSGKLYAKLKKCLIQTEM